MKSHILCVVYFLSKMPSCKGSYNHIKKIIVFETTHKIQDYILGTCDTRQTNFFCVTASYAL